MRQSARDLRHKEMIDPETGEKMLVAVPIKWNKYDWWKEPWAVAFIHNVAEALMDERLRGGDLRVLGALIKMIDFGNEFVIPRKKIAERLHTQPNNISRSITSLVDCGYLIRGDIVDGKRVYRLNSQIMWRGHKKERDKVIKHDRKILQFPVHNS